MATTWRSSAPGFKGAFALDDAYCAGRIVALLGAERTDAAIAAELLAASFPDAHTALLARTYGPPGLEEDILFCSRESVLPVVPRLAGMVGRGRRDRRMRYRFAFGTPAGGGRRRRWSPRASRSRRGRGCGRSSAAAMPPTPRWRQRPCLRDRADVDRDRRRLLRAGLARRRAGRARLGRPGAGGGRPRTPVEQTGPTVGHGARARSPAGRRSPSATDGSASTRASTTRSTPPSGGFAVAPVTAARGRGSAARSGRRRASATSSVQPELGATLRRIAARGAGGVLHGRGRRGDLRGVVARGVRPGRRSSRAGSSRCGSTTRASRSASCRRRRRACARWRRSACWSGSSPGLAGQIRCVQLALEDALARVRDGADVAELITPAFLDARRAGRDR